MLRIFKNKTAAENSVAVFDSEPLIEIDIWPQRSLTKKGFRNLMFFTSAMLVLPSLPFVLMFGGWVLLPHLLVVLLLFWTMFKLNIRAGRVHEKIRIWRDLFMVTHTKQNGEVLTWQADPHWVRVLTIEGKRNEARLRLASKDNSCGLAAFLVPEERRALALEIKSKLQHVKTARAL